MIEQYQPSYYDNLISCLEQHNDYIKPELPEIGYVYTKGSEFVAFGFLRMVEGSYCQIDGLTTNPNFDSEIRHLALDSIVTQLIDKAKQLKLKGIISFTGDYSIVKRAETHGFQLQPYSFISLRLE